MKRDVDAGLLGDVEQLGTHAPVVGERAGHRHLHAGARVDVRILQRDAAGEARDHVDVEAVGRDDRGDLADLLRGELAPQQRDDSARPPLLVDPRLVAVGFHRREVDGDAQPVPGKEQILEHGRGRLRVGNLHQQAQREIVVDDRLADVQDVDVMLGQHRGQFGKQAAPVFAGHVDEDDFVGQLGAFLGVMRDA